MVVLVVSFGICNVTRGVSRGSDTSRDGEEGGRHALHARDAPRGHASGRGAAPRAVCAEGDADGRRAASELLVRARDAEALALVVAQLACEAPSAQIVAAHSRFLADAYAQLGEQKIDLLIDYPGRTNRAPIFERARSQGQLL